MKKVFRYLALLAGVTMTFGSCTQEEYNDAVILFAPDTLRLDGNGDIRTLDFLASGDGVTNLSTDCDWLTVAQEQTGQASRYVLTAAYNDSEAERTANLTLRHDAAAKTIVAVQEAATVATPFLTVGRQSNVFPNVGGHASLRLVSNAAWTITKSEDADWLIVNGGTMSGIGTAVIDLLATPNETVGANRTATLTVTLDEHPEVTQQVVLTQNCFDVTFNLSATSLLFNRTVGSSATLVVQSTYDWHLGSLPDWLEADRTAASGFMVRDTVTFRVIDTNDTGDPRTATVTLYDGSTPLGSVVLTQQGEDVVPFVLTTENVRVSTFQSGDGAVENLFDNDPSTYFTTYWNSYDVTVPQWIVVDLGDLAAEKISFSYQNRDKLDYVPTRVLLQVTDDAPSAHIWQQEGDAYTDADRNWQTVAAYEGDEWCPVEAGATSANLVGKASKAYRYWRFYVEKAKQNPSYEADYPDAFCFQLSELRVNLHR